MAVAPEIHTAADLHRRIAQETQGLLEVLQRLGESGGASGLHEVIVASPEHAPHVNVLTAQVAALQELISRLPPPSVSPSISRDGVGAASMVVPGVLRHVYDVATSPVATAFAVGGFALDTARAAGGYALSTAGSIVNSAIAAGGVVTGTAYSLAGTVFTWATVPLISAHKMIAAALAQISSSQEEIKPSDLPLAELATALQTNRELKIILEQAYMAFLNQGMRDLHKMYQQRSSEVNARVLELENLLKSEGVKTAEGLEANHRQYVALVKRLEQCAREAAIPFPTDKINTLIKLSAPKADKAGERVIAAAEAALKKSNESEIAMAPERALELAGPLQEFYKIMFAAAAGMKTRILEFASRISVEGIIDTAILERYGHSVTITYDELLKIIYGENELEVEVDGGGSIKNAGFKRAAGQEEISGACSILGTDDPDPHKRLIAQLYEAYDIVQNAVLAEQLLKYNPPGKADFTSEVLENYQLSANFRIWIRGAQALYGLLLKAKLNFLYIESLREQLEVQQRRLTDTESACWQEFCRTCLAKIPSCAADSATLASETTTPAAEPLLADVKAIAATTAVSVELPSFDQIESLAQALHLLLSFYRTMQNVALSSLSAQKGEPPLRDATELEAAAAASAQAFASTSGALDSLARPAVDSEEKEPHI